MANIRCPSCRQLIGLDGAPRGQIVKCPACLAEFPAADRDEIAAGLPRVGGSAQEGIQTPEMRLRERPFEDDDGIDIDAGPSKWRWTATGLRLVWWGALMFLLISLAMGGVMIVQPFDPAQAQAQPLQVTPFFVVMIVGGCMVWIAGPMAFIGMCMGATAPNASARWRAIASCVCVVLCIGGALLFGVLVGVKAVQQARQQGGPPPQMDPAAMRELMTVPILIQAFFVVLAAIFWMLFHAAVAAHFQNARLLRFTYITLTIWVVALVFNYASALVIPKAFGMDETALMRLQSSVNVVANLITYPTYLLVCSQTIAAIRTRLPAARDGEPPSQN
jgi:hypothetical protein